MLTPEAIPAIRALILIAAGAGFVAIIVATIRALIAHEKQQSRDDRNL